MWKSIEITKQTLNMIMRIALKVKPIQQFSSNIDYNIREDTEK